MTQNKNLFATVLTYPAPSSNYRGESEENRTVLQKITKGGKEYPVISPEAMRNALREHLIQADLPNNRKRLHNEEQLAVEFKAFPNAQEFADDFLFGFMVADKEAIKHSGPHAGAVLLDTDGYVTETSAANVIVVDRAGNVCCSPAERILGGISLLRTLRLGLEPSRQGLVLLLSASRVVPDIPPFRFPRTGLNPAPLDLPLPRSASDSAHFRACALWTDSFPHPIFVKLGDETRRASRRNRCASNRALCSATAP